MKLRISIITLLVLFVGKLSAQENRTQDLIKGQILNAADEKPLGSANIINLNQVKGTISDKEGNFTIEAAVNDTLYFTYLGFKPIQVMVTEDWKKYGNVKIKMTEIGYALEEVTIENFKLTGYLEIDAKNIPIYEDYRYRIAGMEGGYEAGSRDASGFSKTLSNIFSPFDYLHNVFGNRPKQMRKLRQMQKEDEIQNLLEDKYDRETLAVLLQVNKDDLNKILKECNYSKTFIDSANDLQILDAISDCYENYRAVNKH